MNRVVCIGNPYIPDDDLGSRVYRYLDHHSIAAQTTDVEVIDGGLAGLNLLRYFDDCSRLVFVDAVHTPETPCAISEVCFRIWDTDRLEITRPAYGHSAGLSYLLQAARAVQAAGPDPEIYLVGARGRAPDSMIPSIAGLCLRVARDGYPLPAISSERAFRMDVQS